MFDVWAKHVRNNVRVEDLELDIMKACDSVEDFNERLRGNGEFHIFPMYAYDYLENQALLDAPICVPQWEMGAKVSYSVYVRKDDDEVKDVKTVKDLGPNHAIRLELGGRGRLGRLLFNNALYREGIKPSTDPNWIREVPTALQAILPVYMGTDGGNLERAHACIISQAGFEYAGKLNPDIPQKLRKIYTSPSVLSHVITCRKDSLDQNQRRSLQVASESLKGQADALRPQALNFTKYDPVMMEDMALEWKYERTASETTEAAEARPPALRRELNPARIAQPPRLR